MSCFRIGETTSLLQRRREGFREEDLAKRKPAVKQEKRQKVVFDPNDVLDLTCKVLCLLSCQFLLSAFQDEQSAIIFTAFFYKRSLLYV